VNVLLAAYIVITCNGELYGLEATLMRAAFGLLAKRRGKKTLVVYT
jgi:hypothetical protein